MRLCVVVCALLLSAPQHLDAAETFCENTKYGTTLCDGTFSGSLVEFTYQDQKISGTIPTELAGLASVTELSLRSTSLSGTLPTALFTKLPSLETFYFYGYSYSRYQYSISGTIPTQVGQLDASRLRSFYLNTGCYRDGWNSKRGVYEGAPAGCISGTIPRELFKNTLISEFTLNSEAISGTLPAQMGDLAPEISGYPYPSFGIRGGRFSGTIPASFVNMGQHFSYLTLDSYYRSEDQLRISGTLPGELGKMTQVWDLTVRHPLSGTIPNLAGMQELNRLDLGPTLTWSGDYHFKGNISGTLPNEMIEQLISQGRIYALSLPNNKLSGTVPPALGRRLTYLNLADNNFSVSAELPPELVRRCISEMKECTGLPPRSCSALGPFARQSAMAVGTCFECPASVAPLAVLIVFIFIFVILATRAYFYLVEKYPNVQGWIATSSIVVAHFQLISVVSSLQALEGSTTKTATSAASLVLFDLTIASPECLLPENVPMTYVAPAIIVGLPLALWAVLAGGKCFYGRAWFISGWKAAGGCRGCLGCNQCCASRDCSRCGCAKLGSELGLISQATFESQLELKFSIKGLASPSEALIADAALLVEEEKKHWAAMHPETEKEERSPFPQLMKVAGGGAFAKSIVLANPLSWTALLVWFVLSIAWAITQGSLALLRLPLTKMRVDNHMLSIGLLLAWTVLSELVIFYLFVLIQFFVGLITLYPPFMYECAASFYAFAQKTNALIALRPPLDQIKFMFSSAWLLKARNEQAQDGKSSANDKPWCQKRPFSLIHGSIPDAFHAAECRAARAARLRALEMQMGMDLSQQATETNGITSIVSTVKPKSLASAAGCQKDDRITMVGTKLIGSRADALAAIDAALKDEETSNIELVVLRDKEGATVQDKIEKKNQEQVDRLEDKITMLFTLLFSTINKVWIQALPMGGGPMALGLVVLVSQLAFLFKLWRHTISLGLKNSIEGKGIDEALSGKRWFRYMLNPLPAARLKVRLRFVVQKYGAHAPFYQFVLWIRQVVLMMGEEYVGKSGFPFAQSGVVLGVLMFSAGAHFSIKPYANVYQNQLEEHLLVMDHILIILGMVHFGVQQTTGAGVVDALMLISLIGIPVYATIRVLRPKKALEYIKSVKQLPAIVRNVSEELSPKRKKKAVSTHEVVVSVSRQDSLPQSTA